QLLKLLNLRVLPTLPRLRLLLQLPASDLLRSLAVVLLPSAELFFGIEYGKGKHQDCSTYPKEGKKKGEAA
ncbi:hypothetical protein PF004_g29456, partial [Phytophthora fragariae]